MDELKEDKSQLFKIIKFIAVIAVILIPTIYTTVFLGSMWDPYGNVDKLPVAVVNLDESCNYNGEELAVGDELVKNLKEDASLDFNFVDEETAQTGLDNGSYYMIITIPENFSYNATTLLEDNPLKMELKYKTNPGKNYIASKMSESAIQKITTSVENSVTEVYAKSVFDELSSIGDQLSDAADGASQINEGLTSLKEGSDTIGSNLKLLYDSSLTFTDGINTYEAGINDYLSAVDKIQDGSKNLNAGITTLNDKSSTLAEGVSSLNAGANTLNSGVSDLQKGSESLLGGLNALSSSLKTSVNDENNKNIKTLTTSLDSLNLGINTINNAIQNSSSDNLTSDFTSLGKNLYNVGTSVKNSSTYINELKTKIAETKEAPWFKALDKATQEEIINGLSSPLTNLSNELNNIATETSSASNNLNSAVNGVSTISSQVNEAKTALGTIASNSDILTDKAKTTVNSLYSGLEKVGTALDNQIIPGAKAINSGITSLKNGSENLANGTATLNSSVPTLTNGIGQIAEGSNTLVQGLNALSENNDSLRSGISTINSASTSISNGASKLYDGSVELSSGADKLKDGSGTLKESLEEGSETIKSTKLSDKSKEMFASPVEGVESINSYIANNGNAMSAYMMCVGLWVGCLAFCILFSTEKDLKNGKENPRAFWTKKALKLLSIAIIQAVIMVSSLMLFNGLDPAYIGKTYLVAITASLSFMAIVYLMNLLLGKVGSFILLVFMVLQLSGSAGTYPIELSDSFFKAIHNYMPFTYAVDGFRNGISTGLSIVPQITVLLVIGIVCSILSVIVVIKKNKSTKTTLPELLEASI